MKTINIVRIRRALYYLKHRYANMNNVVIGVAFVIAASWAWGAVSMMQRNFGLQKEVDAQKRELQLTELEVQTLQYQQNYYRSDEYKELAARERLGLALPGEKVLMLPPNSEQAKKEPGAKETMKPSGSGAAISNFEQWMNFLTGKSAANLQK